MTPLWLVCLYRWAAACFAWMIRALWLLHCAVFLGPPVARLMMIDDGVFLECWTSPVRGLNHVRLDAVRSAA